MRQQWHSRQKSHWTKNAIRHRCGGECGDYCSTTIAILRTYDAYHLVNHQKFIKCLCVKSFKCGVKWLNTLKNRWTKSNTAAWAVYSMLLVPMDIQYIQWFRINFIHEIALFAQILILLMRFCKLTFLQRIKWKCFSFKKKKKKSAISKRCINTRMHYLDLSNVVCLFSLICFKFHSMIFFFSSNTTAWIYRMYIIYQTNIIRLCLFLLFAREKKHDTCGVNNAIHFVCVCV